MTAKILATLDPAHKGPRLELREGGSVVTFDTNSTDAHRMVRGTIGKTAGTASFEFGVWTDTTGTLPGNVYVGIALGTASTSQYVGEGSDSIGYNLGDGGIYTNGVLDTSGDAQAASMKQIITVVLDIPALEVRFYVNGSLIAGTPLTADGPWYPAVTIAGDIAFDLLGYINFGREGFDFPNIEGAVGWFDVVGGHEPIYLCAIEDGGFISGPSDSPPNQNFLPRITNGPALEMKLDVDVYLWSQGAGSNSSFSFSVIEFDNFDGYFDSLIPADCRDFDVELSLCPSDGTLDDEIVFGHGVYERLDSNGQQSVRLQLSDVLTRLQTRMQQKRFKPWDDPGVAWRGLPITIGGVRQADAGSYLYDAANRLYKLNDSAMSNVATMRDEGAPLDPTAAPPQFSLTSDLQGVQLESDPIGKLTFDGSNQGQQAVIPGADDVLAGAGLFTTWSNPSNPPDGWVFGGHGSYFRQGLPNWPQNYVAQLVATDTWNPTSGKYGSSFRSPTAVLVAGRSYRVKVHLRRTGGSPPFFIGGMHYGFQMRSALDNNAASAITGHNAPVQIGGDSPLIFTYTVPAGSDRYLYLIANASEGSTVGSATGQAYAEIYGVQVEELAEQVELPLEMIGYADTYTEILENRAMLTADEWVVADAVAIDDDLGYGIGFRVENDETFDEVSRRPLDTVCGAIFPDFEGKIRTRYLKDPELAYDEDIAAEYTIADLAFGVEIIPDLAPGLASQIGVKHNWTTLTDTDLVSDTLILPGALRTQFKKVSQIEVPTSVSVAGSYAHSRFTKPLDSLLDDPILGALEIDRINNFYRGTRSKIAVFVRFTVYFDPNDGVPRLIFGDVIRMTIDRYGLDAGKKMVVKSTALRAYVGQLDVTAWCIWEDA